MYRFDCTIFRKKNDFRKISTAFLRLSLFGSEKGVNTEEFTESENFKARHLFCIFPKCDAKKNSQKSPLEAVIS